MKTNLSFLILRVGDIFDSFLLSFLSKLKNTNVLKFIRLETPRVVVNFGF